MAATAWPFEDQRELLVLVVARRQLEPVVARERPRTALRVGAVRGLGALRLNRVHDGHPEWLVGLAPAARQRRAACSGGAARGPRHTGCSRCTGGARHARGSARTGGAR